MVVGLRRCSLGNFLASDDSSGSYRHFRNALDTGDCKHGAGGFGGERALSQSADSFAGIYHMSHHWLKIIVDVCDIA